MGLGDAFARETVRLKDDENVSVGLVVNAIGRTSIERWGPGQHLYLEALKRARSAQKFGTIKGVLWHQGEADVVGSPSHASQLAFIMLNLRRDLGQPSLPIVIGQVYRNPKHEEKISKFNDRLAELPSLLSGIDCVSSKGISAFDGKHFDTKGAMAIGKRFANSMYRLESTQQKESLE